jgi:hypothetical protein
MTEAEAKTKWCPMVRTGLNAGMAVNHHVNGDVEEETRCKGSGCMMFRINPTNPKGAVFCGLAGKPGTGHL